MLARQDAELRVPTLRLLSRMRLVNSRNRLTHAILSTLCHRQAAFLTTGDPASLKPLTQRGIVADLQEALRENLPVHTPAADTSRVSRALASGSVRLPRGLELDLRRLCPSPREVHRGLVREVLRREGARIVTGQLDGALTDQQIAQDLSARCVVPTSRRAVAFIRKDLGAPDARTRTQRGSYLTATAGFSSLRLAQAATLKAMAPRAPGVYELRIAPPDIDYPAGRSPVIYLGSSTNLRKRLFDQIGGRGRNAHLARYMETGRARVRWMLVPDGWRQLEREVYRHFVETFGAPPACNRMSP